jgi:hypothetical protein
MAIIMMAAMAELLPFVSGSEQQVTSSALVRQFGVWQERAARAPVYILHHGRPRLVMVSLDLMDALAGATVPPAARSDCAVSALIDAVEEPVVTIGDDGAIALSNAAARARFGALVDAGARPAGLSTASGAFLADAVGRVLRTGHGETLEIVPNRYPDRRLHAAVSPLPTGCLVRFGDLSTAEELRASEGERAALLAALEATRGAAVARISLRGYVASPTAAFAAMTGAAVDQLAAARFVTLLEVGDRPRVGEAIEDVIRHAATMSIDAKLLVRGAGATAVRIGLSPIKLEGRVEEVLAVITVSGA